MGAAGEVATGSQIVSAKDTGAFQDGCLAISIAVSLPVANHGDRDHKAVHSNNCTTSELCNNSINKLDALLESFELPEGNGVLVLEHKLVIRRA